MPQWTDRFQDHPVHQQLQGFKDLLSKVEKKADTGPSPEVTESIERLKQIADQTETVFSTLDPLMTSQAPLDNINNHLQQTAANCNQYLADGNADNLNTANANADGVLIQLGSLPIIRTTQDLEGLSASIQSLRRSVGQYRRYVSDEHVGLRAEVDQAKAELGSLNSSIAAQQARLDEVVSEFQRQFSESEERRRTDFANSEKDRDTQFRDLRDKQAHELRIFQEEQSAQSRKHLEDIEAHKARAEELVYVIANTGMVGGYQKIANDERKVAFGWQVVVVIAVVGLIAFAIYAFLTSLKGDVSWQAFGTRFLVVVAFGILAAYAARQADRHSAVERASRRLELALASVDPYLVGLPEETQHQVKKDLAMRFFSEPPETDQKTEEVSGTSADVFRMMTETINELAKKTPGPS